MPVPAAKGRRACRDIYTQDGEMQERGGRGREGGHVEIHTRGGMQGGRERKGRKEERE